MSLNSKISDRVAQHLATSGKNQTWLAAQMGVNRSQASRLIAGKNAWTLENLERVAEAFGVAVQALVFGGDPVLSLSAEEQAILALFRADGYHGLLTLAAGRIART